MLSVLISMSVIEAVVFFMTVNNIENTLTSSSQALSGNATRLSSETMSDLSLNRLQEMAADKAVIADELFSDIKKAVRIAAGAAEQICAHPERYPEREVPLPDASRNGEMTAQLLYYADTDPADPAVRSEALLLGNAQDALYSVISNLGNLSSLYIATESGFMIQVDRNSGAKLDADGNLIPFTAKERPWYQGAAAQGDVYFTQDIPDLHTRNLTIMCGVPIVCEGKFMGVAGGDIYINDIRQLISRVGLLSSGEICFLNENGVVLFSTLDSGPLAPDAANWDLRLSDDPELAATARAAVEKKQGVALLTMEGKRQYVAYAPMKTIGWSILVIESVERVDAASEALRAELERTSEEALHSTNRHINRSIFIMSLIITVAILFAVVQSMRIAQRLGAPIRSLAAEVSHIRGDQLDFHWEGDTGDETQLLADSFTSLTERLKTYIRDMTMITAERERIRTELSMAEKIQRAYLPSQFPPFPERNEFSLYASMDPAREIGGDFYDFFLIDDDHLGLVIADVSGKGIPGALLMMVARAIIRNLATIGNPPAEILRNANEALCDNNPEKMFVTAWVGILTISTGVLKAANAGHEYPVLRDAGGPFAILREKHGFVLGGMRGMRYTEYELKMAPGSKLFVYTDGVPEATGADSEMFGLERMVSALNEDPDAPPETILASVRRAVDSFVKNAEPFDDLTMLCLEYKGSGKALTPPAS